MPLGFPALALPRIDRLTIWLYLLQAKNCFYRSAISVNPSALLLLKSGNKNALEGSVPAGRDGQILTLPESTINHGLLGRCPDNDTVTVGMTSE
jgi:hypothetical protein